MRIRSVRTNRNKAMSFELHARVKDVSWGYSRYFLMQIGWYYWYGLHWITGCDNTTCQSWCAKGPPKAFQLHDSRSLLKKRTMWVPYFLLICTRPPWAVLQPNWSKSANIHFLKIHWWNSILTNSSNRHRLRSTISAISVTQLIPAIWSSSKSIELPAGL